MSLYDMRTSIRKSNLHAEWKDTAENILALDGARFQAPRVCKSRANLARQSRAEHGNRAREGSERGIAIFS